MDLSRTVAGLSLEHPVMNAAGTCKTLADMEKLARSAVSAVVLGSITKERRDGNAGDVYWCGDTHSVNSLGMPNPGAAGTERNLPQMARMAHDRGKPLIVSVAGFSPEEYGDLAALAHAGGADAVELNLGCPNVWDGGAQKRIASFDTGLMRAVLRRARAAVVDGFPIFVKLSPYSDPQALEEAVRLVQACGIQGLTGPNTFPNAFAVDERGKPRISPAEGFAGYAGRAYKPIALGQVRQYRRHLAPELRIIGVGGIWTGRDVRDFLAAGADAVQVGTAYLERDAQVFGDILAELVDLTDG